MARMRAGRAVAALSATVALSFAAAPVMYAPAFAEDRVPVQMTHEATGNEIAGAVTGVQLTGPDGSVLRNGTNVRYNQSLNLRINWALTSIPAAGDYFTYKVPEVISYGRVATLRMVSENGIHYGDATLSEDGLLTVVFNDAVEESLVRRGGITMSPPVRHEAIQNVEPVEIALPGRDPIVINYIAAPYAYVDGGKVSASGVMNNEALAWDVQIPGANRVTTNSTIELTPSNSNWQFDVDAISAMGTINGYEVVSVEPGKLVLRAARIEANSPVSLTHIPGVVVGDVTDTPAGLNVTVGGDQAEIAGNAETVATRAPQPTEEETSTEESASEEPTSTETAVEPTEESSIAESAPSTSVTPTVEPVPSTTEVVTSTVETVVPGTPTEVTVTTETTTSTTVTTSAPVVTTLPTTVLVPTDVAVTTVETVPVDSETTVETTTVIPSTTQVPVTTEATVTTMVPTTTVVPTEVPVTEVTTVTPSETVITIIEERPESRPFDPSLLDDPTPSEEAAPQPTAEVRVPLVQPETSENTAAPDNVAPAPVPVPVVPLVPTPQQQGNQSTADSGTQDAASNEVFLAPPSEGDGESNAQQEAADNSDSMVTAESANQAGQRVSLGNAAGGAQQGGLPIQRDIQRALDRGNTNASDSADSADSTDPDGSADTTNLSLGAPQGETHSLRAAEKDSISIPVSDVLLNGLAGLIIVAGVAALFSIRKP